MKKILIFILMISLVGLISACGRGEEDIENIESSPQVDSSEATENERLEFEETESEELKDEELENTNVSEESDHEESIKNDIHIKMSFNDEEIIVKMYDNPTSRDFLTLLPLTLEFEDYATAEKISYLPRELSTDDAPRGFDPSVGDLTLYAPWANLAIFYKDFGYANGLIPLGRIESGIEKLAAIKENFTVVIEKVE
jgi:hypothetical protein